VTLCVNACWGAQPAAVNQQALPTAWQVLIHHGVPAVLECVTRLLIEALSFIRTFAQALRSRLPIDQAVAIARQQLLTLYNLITQPGHYRFSTCIQILMGTYLCG